MRTGSATARTTGRRTWLFCAAWLSIWPRWSPQKRRSRVSSSAPDGITPTWSPSSPKPQKAKCDSPARLVDMPGPAPLYATFLAELRARGFEGDLSSTYSDRTVLATDNSIYHVTPEAIAF